MCLLICVCLRFRQERPSSDYAVSFDRSVYVFVSDRKGLHATLYPFIYLHQTMLCLLICVCLRFRQETVMCLLICVCLRFRQGRPSSDYAVSFDRSVYVFVSDRKGLHHPTLLYPLICLCVSSFPTGKTFIRLLFCIVGYLHNMFSFRTDREGLRPTVLLPQLGQRAAVAVLAL